MKIGKHALPLLLALCLLAGCGQGGEIAEESRNASPETLRLEQDVFIDRMVIQDVDLEYETMVLSSGSAAQSTLLLPVASGTATKSSARAVVDYSNARDGYVMVQFTGSSSKRLRVQVKGPSTTYTYELPIHAWTTYPLSDGNGNYQVTVLENTVDKKYAIELSASFSVTLTDEFAPFLRPNQYVNFGVAVNSIQKAKDLTSGVSDPLAKVEKIYHFVVNNVTYDKQKAASVPSTYLPVLDTTLSTKKGICFDYAALMTGMLRSQGIPCKLVVGYAGKAYHAWISVWTEKTGWIDGAIYFDGTSWQRMDPTFASSGKSSQAIMKYIGDGNNYTSKYFY